MSSIITLSFFIIRKVAPIARMRLNWHEFLEGILSIFCGQRGHLLWLIILDILIILSIFCGQAEKALSAFGGRVGLVVKGMKSAIFGFE